ncbi:MAG: hypothetical protein KGI66_00980 [Patescibacteria group bacterium]|nr:hypothetical protein [Patescibacteria group bacterium]
MDQTNTLIGPGQLLKNAWNTLSKHWQIFAMIALVPTAIKVVAVLFAITVIGLPIAILLVIASVVFTLAMYIGVIDAVNRYSTDAGAALTAKGQYKLGFSMFWSFLLVAIIACLVSWGSFVLLIIPGIIVAVYTSMYAFARVLDDKRGFAAFAESYSLVKGHWWAVFGRGVLAAVIVILFSAIVSAILALIPILGPIVSSFIVTAAAVPFIVSYTRDIYADLKRVRQPDVKTSAFKGWLIAFIVIGILAVIILPFTVFSALWAARGWIPAQDRQGSYAPYDSAPFDNGGMTGTVPIPVATQ